MTDLEKIRRCLSFVPGTVVMGEPYRGPLVEPTAEEVYHVVDGTFAIVPVRVRRSRKGLFGEHRRVETGYEVYVEVVHRNYPHEPDDAEWIRLDAMGRITKKNVRRFTLRQAVLATARAYVCDAIGQALEDIEIEELQEDSHDATP